MNVDYSTRESLTIRQPATANLMIDSYDRNENLFPTPWDFQIAKKESIMNGFFTRVGVTEVVLEWFEDNISSVKGNNTIEFDLSGTGGNTYSGTQTITLLQGNYTVAEVLDSIVQGLNDLSGTTGIGFSLVPYMSSIALESSGGQFEVLQDILATQLDFSLGVMSIVNSCLDPDLRPYRYIDFVSSQVTYNQNLKDNATNRIPRDVLCRWYFSNDEQNMLDKYNFPILMGYKEFCLRRLYNPPKQIRWDPQMPIGNLFFQVFNEDGEILTDDGKSEWLMTLQISEN